MRRRTPVVALAAAALLCGTLATFAVANPIFAEVAGFKVTVNAQIKPRALPRSHRAPVSIHLTSRIASTDGAHVAPASRATIDIDRDLAIDPLGVPACRAAQLEGKTTAGAEESCRGAIVGSGSAAAEIAFPGKPLLQVRSRLIAVNGGSEGGTATILLHAYLEAPVAQAFVAPITLRKLPKGSYGLRARVTVPKIASGAGSLTAVDLRLQGKVRGGSGKSRGYLTARCPNGSLLVEPTVEFGNGDTAGGLMAIGCKPTGQG